MNDKYSNLEKFKNLATGSVLVLGFSTALIVSFNHLLGTDVNISNNEDVLRPVISCEEEIKTTKLFNTGEHILAIPCNFRKNAGKVFQLAYHPGYEFLGMNIDRTTQCALYCNTEPVVATSTGKDFEGKPVFSEFGRISYENNKVDNEDSDYITYGPGEHILAVPTSLREYDGPAQGEYHDGYEVCDVTACTYGRLYIFGGGYMVYSNTEEVKCKKNDEGKCVEFGTPIQKDNIKVLKK